MRTGLLVSYLMGAFLSSIGAEEGKLPVPEAAAREEAEKRLRETFKDGYARRESAGRASLSAELLKLARETRDNPVERYVLFEEAAALAAQAGEVKRALGAVEEKAKLYAINLLADQAGVLAIGAREARSAPLLNDLAAASLGLAEAAVLADRYDLAAELLKSSRSLAGKGKGTALVAAAREKEAELEELRRAYPGFQEARGKLARSPGDGEANLAVGRFLCLLKGDWKQGLGHLVKAVEVRLTPLAKKDQAEPRSAADQVLVGDGWWALAEEEKGLASRHARARALHWYQLALPELSGLAKRRVEERTSAPASGKDDGLPRGCVLLLTFEKDTLYEKDGNLHVKDLSGKENHGRVLGPKLAAGKAGAALRFDGVDDAVDCGNSQSLGMSEAFTVAAWVSSEGLKGDAVDYIVSKDDWQSGNRGFVLRCGEGGTAMLTVGSGGWKSAKGPRLQRNRWYHLAATFDTETIKIYVDGAASGSEPVSSPMDPSSHNLTIGRGAYAKDRRFHGLIDEVAIFNRALSPGEIKWLFERGRKGRMLR